MGNKCPRVMHKVLFLMPLHENVAVSSEMWLHICFTPLGYLMLIWAVWELILKSSPLLSASQPRAGDRPGSTMDYIGVNTARISHWLANKCFFLFWSCRGECPTSLAVLLEYKFLVSRGEVQWASHQQLLSFLLGINLPVKEGKSIDLQLSWLMRPAHHSQSCNLPAQAARECWIPPGVSPALGLCAAGLDRSCWLLL